MTSATLFPTVQGLIDIFDILENQILLRQSDTLFCRLQTGVCYFVLNLACHLCIVKRDIDQGLSPGAL